MANAFANFLALEDFTNFLVQECIAFLADFEDLGTLDAPSYLISAERPP